MREIMTRERIRRAAEDVGLEEEVDRILTLGDQVLRLEPVERTSVTVPFRLKVGGERVTIFRIGPDYEATGRPGISFPFWSWPVPRNRVLETLRNELLETVPRLDKGAAEEDVRLAITKSSIDELIAAICTIYSEVRRELRLRDR